MARSMVTRKTYRSRYKTTRAGQAVKRAMGVFRARNARLRRRNVRTAGFLGIETKFYDTSRAGYTILTSTDMSGHEADPTTINCISAPAQGDGESNRDGKKINITSMHINGVVVADIQADQTATDLQPMVLIAVVLDTQTNGAQLNSEDVYKNTSGNAALTIAPLRNLQYSARFKILGYKLLKLAPPPITYDGANIEQGGVQASFSFNKKVNIPVAFTGTTEGVANVTNNSIHIIACTNNTGASPTLYYNARIRFVG